MLQFDLNFDGQTKSKPFPAHIAASGRWPGGLIFSDKLQLPSATLIDDGPLLQLGGYALKTVC